MHKLKRSLCYSAELTFSTETVVLQLNSSMASLQQLFLLSLLFHSLLIIKCDDEEDNLLQGINQYRASLNLTALTKNDRAECLADELADQFKNQPCTNTTGSNTVPGTEPQYSDYPKLLTKCHLNVTTTRDGQILPACVPNLDSSLVLSNFTKSQYSGSLNDTKYTGIGIGSEDNWIVVVLTTSTPDGDYAPGTNSDNGAASLTAAGHVVFLLVSFLLLV
ncbi:putative GPI-anchored protein [Sesamum alatum]|uniref:GPI-anchored protein n=1 Tax=Sesamum alatum TaxID=300844 RepID=A0AAE1YPH0_9LAMI|nr:putative GPI-anchored protein [Sesamum alatum]